jgi:hypothetical protein
MSVDDRPHGIILGRERSVMPKITVHTAADVSVVAGCTDIGDATHYLSIMLPFQNEEIRIPHNQRALRALHRKAGEAIVDDMPAGQQEA